MVSTNIAGIAANVLHRFAVSVVTDVHSSFIAE